MEFQTKVYGIPCTVVVTLYRKAIPMRIYGSGMGDCDPPEPEEFEFHLLDRKGYPAPWLEAKLTPDDYERLLEESQLEALGERYGYL